MISKKFQMTLSLVLAANIVLPQIAAANVFINEVAWMGNDKGQYGEWVELYNDGTAAVDLKDATLYEAGGNTPIIKLTKSISAGGYYLIARSTPSVPDPVGGLADDLGSFGGSGLSNSGEYLVLKSASGDILDSLDASSGWPAGNVATKQTMQRSSSGGWLTATSTPRAANATASITITSDTDSNISTTTDNSAASNDVVDQEFTDLSSHSDPADLSDKPEDMKVFASAGRNRLALVDTPISFEEKLFNSNNDNIDGGIVSWSFGDGENADGKMAVHTYKYAGDYAVVMNVLNNAENYVARTNVRVVAADLKISDYTANFVKIINLSDSEVNIGGWHLTSGGLKFTFPADTIILSKREVVFPAEATHLNSSFPNIALFSPAGNSVAVFNLQAPTSTQPQAAATPNKPLNFSLLTNEEQTLLEARETLLAIASTDRVIQATSSRAVFAGEKITAVGDDLKSLTTSVTQVTDQSKSILKSIIDLPMSGLKYIKSFF